MGDENRGHPSATLQILDFSPQRLPQPSIEVAQRFVEQRIPLENRNPFFVQNVKNHRNIRLRHQDGQRVQIETANFSQNFFDGLFLF